jgi:hypothetical protein
MKEGTRRDEGGTDKLWMRTHTWNMEEEEEEEEATRQTAVALLTNTGNA